MQFIDFTVLINSIVFYQKTP